MKKISIVTACYNEAENVEILINRVQKVMGELKRKYEFEHIFIDNASTDKTVDILKKIAKKNPAIKIIVNSRNFGHIRSPFYGLLQGDGDAVISLVADLQDPPELILDFVQMWERGYRIVVGVKTSSKEHPILYWLRNVYYRFITRLSDIEMVQQFTGFGLYDQKIIKILRSINDPYPYFRGLISDIGFEIAKISYQQPKRKHGHTKNNFYTLFDMGLTGITNHTKIPLRFAIIFGFLGSVVSVIIGLLYFFYKLFYWHQIPVGVAPLVIGVFFIGSVQLFFLGIVGEYVGAIYTYSQNRPLVIEKERINF